MIEIIAQTRQAYDKVLLNRALIENVNESVRSGHVDDKVITHAHKGRKVDLKTRRKVIDITGEIAKRTYTKDLVAALIDLRVLLGVEQESLSSVKLISTLREQMTPLPRLEALLDWAELFSC